MNRKMKQIVICIAVAALVQGVVGQSYTYAMGRFRKTKEERFEALAKELNLTEEQQAQLKQQRSEQEEIVKELRDKFRQEIKNLREELEKPDTDQERLEKIATKIKILGSDLLDQRIEGILAIKEILTPQQFEQLSEKRRARIEKIKEIHKKFHRKIGEGGLF